MPLPKGVLTVTEQAVLGRYVQEITLFQNLLQAKQRAYLDLIGLALSARGLNPDDHEVDQLSGVIKVKEVS